MWFSWYEDDIEEEQPYKLSREEWEEINADDLMDRKADWEREV